MVRKIKIVDWESNVPDYGKDGKTIIGTKPMKENLLMALNVLIGGKKPEDMPRGIEKFQIMGKIAEAFDAAIKSNVLELEDREYKFLKDTIESDVPSQWGMNVSLNKAINTFLDAKEE